MLKIGICDDSPDCIEILKLRLEPILAEMHIETVLESFDSLEQLKNHLANERLDILFLDIMFGEQSSVDWCVQNLTAQNMQLIFMTEYPAEAYNISEVNHSYFLVKSRTTDDILKKSLRKVIGKLAHKDPNLMILRSGNNSYTVSADDIMLIEGNNNCISFHMKNGEQMKLYTTMKTLCSELPQNFFRCHKSYIINMNHVTRTQPYEFVLSDGSSVPIPPRKYNKIVEKYFDYINLF